MEISVHDPFPTALGLETAPHGQNTRKRDEELCSHKFLQGHKQVASLTIKLLSSIEST